MKITRNLFYMVLALVAMPAFAQKTFDMNLWQDDVRGNNGDPADIAKVRVFLPSEKEATGRAVVICPGGGYDHLALDHEGYDWGQFFTDQGIAAIVLKYRMPHGNTDVPILDAEEAMRMVRKNAKAWHVNPSDVGIMGFSAGGHLASTIATHSQGDAKPDFQILFYPVITMDPGYTHQGSHDNLLGKNPKKKEEQLYSNERQITHSTPRACILLSDDDDVVQPINGVNYYAELFRHDVPATLHVYPDGGHGYGMNNSFRYHIEMLLDLKAWLRSF